MIHEAPFFLHQDLTFLPIRFDTRARTRLVEPKSLMFDRFVKKSGSSWETWSYLGGAGALSAETSNEGCKKTGNTRFSRRTFKTLVRQQ